MTILVALNHTTHYRYDKFIQIDPQIVRLRPAPHCRTKIVSYSLRIEPEDHFINWQQDPFSNYLARLVFPQKSKEFKLTVDLVAEMAVYNPFDFFLEPEAEHYPFTYKKDLQHDLQPYLVRHETTRLFRKLLKTISRKKQRTIDFLVAINQALYKEIDYVIRMEPGVQTPEQTLTLGRGSCRDSAWLMVQVLRHMGLASRFVSGYLIQLKADTKALDGPSGTETDFTDLHAWCEVYLPGAGWIGLDPTSGLLAGEGHIPVACTPEPTGAAPITGAIEKCEVEFHHEMRCERVYESPRVTQPYTDEQWQSILTLGDKVDAELQAHDVRLTMGGEPTFVSIDDRDGDEWNTAALGPSKRILAAELLHKLSHRYGQNGFLHFGQGKWYPGEQLPRWALSAYWRKDGQPCWQNPTYLADESDARHYTQDDARQFIQRLVQHLQVPEDYVTSCYEDAWYYLWRERCLPVNVDPFKSNLEDEYERARLMRVFSQKLDHEVGFVLPIRREQATATQTAAWVSGKWPVRDERLYLIPGDSAMGYRLPLSSLPWAKTSDLPHVHERDPFAPVTPLAFQAVKSTQTSAYSGGGIAGGVAGPHGAGLDASAHSAIVGSSGAYAQDKIPAAQESAAWITRTALCVEVRNRGRSSGPEAEASSTQQHMLYVFMPPLEYLEDYLELLHAIEQTATDLEMPVVLEGYPPPRDPRMQVLQVTPDPGVIEVNIHPASNWTELVDHTEFLYQAAYETRLSTEKFMMDGRHTGTGGGNHFVLGGATPADSPFLRRPDLLPSLLTYWHNHPSLSYLFSGLFIGPTSQAPRIDEARNDQVYEMEIALQEIERQLAINKQCPPWMIDRTLRNLLIDVTGNTHRSEFCIDKLYSPDGSTGRLGLLELRAFEMPPHARMSLAQQLLIRALIARFWKQPYKGQGKDRLTRWGTQLHDRFLLPTFIQMDFEDVITELNQAGFAFDSRWFESHFEFRFPLVGDMSAHGVHLTLRNALEPWHVMGEEGSAGGTVRYVDSSLERLEVKLSGYNANRHTLTVNGIAPEMQPTGKEGEYVIGVRYRAWQVPFALHPTIPEHAPLSFDLVDNWLSRSLGGCRYHVTHPGGRNYDTLPINSYEAESRRLSRFFTLEHTPGRIPVQHSVHSKEFPFTLDLRRTS